MGFDIRSEYGGSEISTTTLGNFTVLSYTLPVGRSNRQRERSLCGKPKAEKREIRRQSNADDEK